MIQLQPQPKWRGLLVCCACFICEKAILDSLLSREGRECSASLTLGLKFGKWYQNEVPKMVIVYEDQTLMLTLSVPNVDVIIWLKDRHLTEVKSVLQCSEQWCTGFGNSFQQDNIFTLAIKAARVTRINLPTLLCGIKIGAGEFTLVSVS